MNINTLIEHGAGALRPEAPNTRLRLESVSLSIERSTHADHADPRNEALSNLLAFLRLLVRPRSATGSIATQCLLRNVSASIPVGSVVGVMSTLPTSARGLLEIVANAAAPDQGSVVRHGRVASFGQIWCIPSAYDSCRYNLQLLGELLAAPQDTFRRAFAMVEQFNKKLPVLDMPLRRTPRWAFADLALVLVCELGYEVLVVPEVMLPTSGDVQAYWRDYLARAHERGQVIVLGSRRADNVLPLSTHLLLMDGSELVDFGTTAAVRERHAEVVLRAIEAREEPRYPIPVPASVEDDEDDDDDEEEEARNVGDTPSVPGIASEAESERNVLGPLPSRRGLAAGALFADRKSDLCEIIAAGVGGSRLFRSDMSAAEPIDDVAVLAAGLENIAVHGGAVEIDDPHLSAAKLTKVPVTYREEGVVIRIVLETKAPNLWIFPIVDLGVRKSTILRSFSPREVLVREPGRIAFDIEIPPEFLQRIVYRCQVAVCIADRDHGIEDIASAINLFTFLNLSRSSPGRPTPFSMTRRLETFFRSAAQISDEPVDSDARFRLAGLSLADASGNPLLHDEDGFEAPRAASEGFNVVLNIDVSARPLKLACLVDLRLGRLVVLRLMPPSIELAPGSHRLTVCVPAGLLAPNRFEVHVELVEEDLAAGAHERDVQALAAVVRVPVAEDMAFDPDDRLMRWRYGADHGLLHAKLTWKYHDSPMGKDDGRA